MKQGKAQESRAGDRKVEPSPHAMGVEAVADMGSHKIYLKVPTMHEGRGYKAPVSGETYHPCGSQGKHK